MGHSALSFLTATLLLIAGATLVATAGGAKGPLDTMGVHRPAKPFPAPDLPFASLDGREVRLRDLQGKAILLGFFTTW